MLLLVSIPGVTSDNSNYVNQTGDNLTRGRSMAMTIRQRYVHKIALL